MYMYVVMPLYGEHWAVADFSTALHGCQTGREGGEGESTDRGRREGRENDRPRIEGGEGEEECGGREGGREGGER